MTSIFDEDDDSDKERSESQRRILASIRSSALRNEAPVIESEPEDIGEAQEQFSEEGELKRLRENARYQRYAVRKKRTRSVSPGSPKRPRANELLDSPKPVTAQIIAKDVRSGGAVQSQPINVDVSKFGNGDVARGGQSRLGATSPIRDGRLPEPKVASRSGPKVDPKIIDDSSDDDSASDESSGDAPIGPALPGEAIPLQGAVSAIPDNLPIQKEVTLGASHGSYVSSISIDKAGNRLVTGSMDSTVKIWDFNAMDRSLQPFKTINPLDEAPIRNLQYSATGGFFLCSGGANTAVILDRDGYIFSQTTKGDMYIVDMARTKGHTGAILSAKWRPAGSSSSTIIATTSSDATVRLWDVSRTSKVPMVENPVIHQLRVTKLRNARGGRTVASAMDWVADGKSCVIACSDGRLKVVDPDAYSMRPIGISREVFRQGTEVTSMTTAPEACSAPLILVRSNDDCLRVFDIRNLYAPLKEIRNLPNVISETNASFLGQNGEHFVTGTSANRKDGSVRGTLRLFETKSFRELWKSETDGSIGSVVSTTWNRNINQIIYGSADGNVRVLYHPTESRKGVLSCIAKSDFRKRHGVVSLGVGEALLPSDLHRRSSGQGKRLSSDEAVHANPPMSKRGRREASKALKPKPLSGQQTLRNESSRSLAKHLSAREVTQEWSRDPREAILRYAEIAEKDPKFTAAYRTTQPETLLADKTAEQEEEETRQAIYERDRLRNAKRANTPGRPIDPK